MPSPKPEEPDLNQAIATVEESLKQLKQRYHQVQRDLKRREQLRELKQELKQQAKANNTENIIRAELKHIEQEIANLELNLESRLWNWKELQEPFWQAVRFTGLGIIIGWVLRFFSS